MERCVHAGVGLVQCMNVCVRACESVSARHGVDDRVLPGSARWQDPASITKDKGFQTCNDPGLNKAGGRSFGCRGGLCEVCLVNTMADTRASFLCVGVRHVKRLPGETLEPGWTCAGGHTAQTCLHAWE